MSYSGKKSSKLRYLMFPGLFFLISGIFLFFLWHQVMVFITSSIFTIKPGSKMFEGWRKTQVPPYLEVYMFNWTNSEHAHNNQIKPEFEEIGPFKFKEYKEKINITFNDNNTVSYRLKKTWYFDEEASCCSLSTNITIVNAILVAFSHKVKDYGFFAKSPINLALKAFTPDIAVTKNVSQLLFEGYVDQLLALGKTLEIPGLPKVDRFGLYYGKNDSAIPDGYFNMDLSDRYRGLLRRWNTVEETNFYEGNCAKVKGSAGELYPPGLRGDSISLFSPDMCRTLKMDYKEDVQIHGVTGYKYIAHHSMLDNGTKIKENLCYCNGDCMPSGVLNISSCRMGSPSFTSLPHFLHADPFYINKIVGMNPDPEKHQMFFVIEPDSGIPLQAAIRVQSNIHLKPITYMSLIDDVPDVMYPLMWMQVQFTASQEFASGLLFLKKIPMIIKITAGVIIVIGIILMLVSHFVKRKMDAEKSSFREQVPLQSPKPWY